MQDFLKPYRAILFDLNGTMINDMSYHIKAWHRVMTDLGANISPERMKQECYGKNDELIERIFPGRFSAAEKKRMGDAKETQYQKDFKPYLELIAGLDAFLREIKQHHMKTAIGSAAIRSNIDFVVNGLSLHHLIDAIVSADDVEKSKPDPETFLQCAAALQLAPQDCLVFEDTPKGVETALNAGMDCVVITTLHEPDEFIEYPNVIGLIKNYQPEEMNRIQTQKV